MAALSFFILGICGNRVNHLFSQIPFILDETKNYDCCFLSYALISETESS